jgi:hypothetical protein
MTQDSLSRLFVVNGKSDLPSRGFQPFVGQEFAGRWLAGYGAERISPSLVSA